MEAAFTLAWTALWRNSRDSRYRSALLDYTHYTSVLGMMAGLWRIHNKQNF